MSKNGYIIGENKNILDGDYPIMNDIYNKNIFVPLYILRATKRTDDNPYYEIYGQIYSPDISDIQRGFMIRLCIRADNSHVPFNRIRLRKTGFSNLDGNACIRFFGGPGVVIEDTAIYGDGTTEKIIDIPPTNSGLLLITFYDNSTS